MKTCAAGALLTDRSNRGSRGCPATVGISMRNGGRSASSMARGVPSALRSALAFSNSVEMYGPMEVGAGGGATQPAPRRSAAMDRIALVMVMSFALGRRTAGALDVLRIELERFVSARAADDDRSEERRVGKEGRSRWSPYH